MIFRFFQFISKLTILIIILSGADMADVETPMNRDVRNQLMVMMKKELASVEPKDRNSFIELCLSKNLFCSEKQFNGNQALFSWREAIGPAKKDRFWRTYHCVYMNEAEKCPVDGGWTEWTDWSKCDADCEDRGSQTQSRMCANPSPAFGGWPCEGRKRKARMCVGLCKAGGGGLAEAKEYLAETHKTYPMLKKMCVENHCLFGQVQKTLEENRGKAVRYWSSLACVKYGGACPINGGWGQWGEWTECTVKCGHGEVIRKRNCDKPMAKNGGISCQGIYHEKKVCLAKDNCDPDETFTEWSAWTKCSQKCNKYGTQTSVRSCLLQSNCTLGGANTGEIVKTRPCFGGMCPSAGGWAKWGPWTTCSSKCGTGRKVRMRDCSNPIPSGGRGCQGSRIGVTSCEGVYCVQVPPAPGSVNDNTDEEFRRRRRRRRRDALDETLGVVEDEKQASLSREEQAVLMVPEGAVNLTKEAVEKQKRKRLKMKKPIYPALEDDDPILVPLNPDLENLYTQWEPWTPCTAKCGGGTRHRKRTCKLKNTVCRGEVQPVQFCNTSPCPISGAWSNWQPWNPCSSTCGSGVVARYRACDNPIPAFGGWCAGPNKQTQPCTMPKCPISKRGEWSRWSKWTECSQTCGTGTKTRTKYRNVMSQKRLDKALCNVFPCPVIGMWAAWTGWTSCSTKCGLSFTYRERTCTDPAPSFGGDPCRGQGSDVQPCYGGPCTDTDDEGLSLSGNGFVEYNRRGSSTGFAMVFVRFKPSKLRGTLFHLAEDCDSEHPLDCDVSVFCNMTGGEVSAHAEFEEVQNTMTVVGSDPVKLGHWNDVVVVVTERWLQISVNSNPPVVTHLEDSLQEPLNFDGTLTVGANRIGEDGFYGEIAAIRKNFKPMSLVPSAAWVGYGNPHRKKNAKKIILPSAGRHPDFQSTFYSHVYFTQDKYFYVAVSFQITNGEGLLLFNGGEQDSSFLSVNVKDGGLHICLSCGVGAPSCRTAYELTTEQWYFLVISARGSEVLFRLDGGDAVQFMCPENGAFVPTMSMYVGGAGPRDWPAIKEISKDAHFFNGFIDSLQINTVTVSYKMATLLSATAGINAVGFSLSDHVTEIHEHEGSVTSIRCGVPPKIKHSHQVRILWLKDMELIQNEPGVEITTLEGENEVVSTATLQAFEENEGVYSCVMARDGQLIVLSTFILVRYGAQDDIGGDSESAAEWVIFIILIALLVLLCLLPCLYYLWKQFLNRVKGTDTEKESLIAEEEIDESPRRSRRESRSSLLPTTIQTTPPDLEAGLETEPEPWTEPSAEPESEVKPRPEGDTESPSKEGQPKHVRYEEETDAKEGSPDKPEKLTGKPPPRPPRSKSSKKSSLDETDASRVPSLQSVRSRVPSIVEQEETNQIEVVGEPEPEPEPAPEEAPLVDDARRCSGLMDAGDVGTVECSGQSFADQMRITFPDKVFMHGGGRCCCPVNAPQAYCRDELTQNVVPRYTAHYPYRVNQCQIQNLDFVRNPFFVRMLSEQNKGCQPWGNFQ